MIEENQNQKMILVKFENDSYIDLLFGAHFRYNLKSAKNEFQ